MQKHTMAVIMPIIIAPSTPTEPAAGVMATKPATAPVHTPTVVGLRLTLQSMHIHVTAATHVARCVTRNAFESSPSAVSPLPALNPNHPSHKKAAPINTNVTLWGDMGRPGP